MSIDISGPKILFTIPILGGIRVTETVRNGWIVILIVTALCLILTHSLVTKNPSKRQIVAEKLYDMINNLVNGVMGEKYKKFTDGIETRDGRSQYDGRDGDSDGGYGADKQHPSPRGFRVDEVLYGAGRADNAVKPHKRGRKPGFDGFPSLRKYRGGNSYNKSCVPDAGVVKLARIGLDTDRLHSGNPDFRGRTSGVSFDIFRPFHKLFAGLYNLDADDGICVGLGRLKGKIIISI